MIEAIKKWLVAGLIFCGLLRILYLLLANVLFEYITFPQTYNNIIQMAALCVILLLALVCTSLLVNRGNT